MPTQLFELPIIGDPTSDWVTVRTGLTDTQGKPASADLSEKYAVHTRQRCTHGHEYHANSHEYPCPYCTITKLEREKKQSENDILNIRAKVQRLERDLLDANHQNNLLRLQLDAEKAAANISITIPASKIAKEILGERKRQHTDEGWSIEHDDKHIDGELALAAAAYAAGCDIRKRARVRSGPGFCEGKEKWVDAWPWNEDWDKRAKHPRRRQLIISAALIIAEIERLDRQEEYKKIRAGIKKCPNCGQELPTPNSSCKCGTRGPTNLVVVMTPPMC